MQSTKGVLQGISNETLPTNFEGRSLSSLQPFKLSCFPLKAQSLY